MVSRSNSQLEKDVLNLSDQVHLTEQQVWRRIRLSFTNRIRRYKESAELWRAKRNKIKTSCGRLRYRQNLQVSKRKLYEDLLETKRKLFAKEKTDDNYKLRLSLTQKQVQLNQYFNICV